MPLAAVLQPAIARAEGGVRVSRYLHKYIREYAQVLARCPEAAAIFLPSGVPLAAGDWLVQPELASTLRH
eukprot:8862353-Alexandrium_andersonii.AAC.1